MQALGSIEVVGLVAGVEAADVACKTADVTLIGYELARGGGYVTVKVEGQVAAVQAAMDAAEAAASKLTRVVSKIVIPRPHPELEPLVFSAATVGLATPTPQTKATTKPAATTKAKAKKPGTPAPKAESGAAEKSAAAPAPKANAKSEPTAQPEQARPASGSAQKSAPAPDPKPGATPKNPAETTKAPRTSTTRRKQS